MQGITFVEWFSDACILKSLGKRQTHLINFPNHISIDPNEK